VERVGKIVVEIWGETSLISGDVFAKCLDLVGIVLDGAVRVDLGDHFQQAVSGLGAGRAVEDGLFEEF